MKKILLTFTGLLLTIIMGLSVAADTAKKSPPSFMFVLQAKQGEIITIDGKTFLVLKKTDIHHVIEFSDRPYRIVKYISGTDLAKDWKIGKNSFESDPPNAVLVANGKKARIVVLGSMEINESRIFFKLLGFIKNTNTPKKLINATVIIDNTNFISRVKKLDSVICKGVEYKEAKIK